MDHCVLYTVQCAPCDQYRIIVVIVSYILAYRTLYEYYVTEPSLHKIHGIDFFAEFKQSVVPGCCSVVICPCGCLVGIRPSCCSVYICPGCCSVGVCPGCCSVGTVYVFWLLFSRYMFWCCSVYWTTPEHTYRYEYNSWFMFIRYENMLWLLFSRCPGYCLLGWRSCCCSAGRCPGCCSLVFCHICCSVCTVHVWRVNGCCSEAGHSCGTTCHSDEENGEVLHARTKVHFCEESHQYIKEMGKVV